MNIYRLLCLLLPPCDDEQEWGRGHRRGTNDETMFRRLCPRLETRLRRVSSPRLVFFFFFSFLFLYLLMVTFQIN